MSAACLQVAKYLKYYYIYRSRGIQVSCRVTAINQKRPVFGSHVRGEGGPDSDVDLLIVMPVEGSKRDKSIEIGVALHDVRIPKDIIVTTPEEFEWRKEIAGTIERPAVMEGKTLYAKE